MFGTEILIFFHAQWSETDSSDGTHISVEEETNYQAAVDDNVIRDVLWPSFPVTINTFKQTCEVQVVQRGVLLQMTGE